MWGGVENDVHVTVQWHCVWGGVPQQTGFHLSQCCPVASGEKDAERKGRVNKQTAACIRCDNSFHNDQAGHSGTESHLIAGKVTSQTEVCLR